MKGRNGKVTLKARDILLNKQKILVSDLAKLLYSNDDQIAEAKVMRTIARLRMNGMKVMYDKCNRIYYVS